MHRAFLTKFVWRWTHPGRKWSLLNGPGRFNCKTFTTHSAHFRVFWGWGGLLFSPACFTKVCLVYLIKDRGFHPFRRYSKPCKPLCPGALDEDVVVIESTPAPAPPVPASEEINVTSTDSEVEIVTVGDGFRWATAGFSHPCMRLHCTWLGGKRRRKQPAQFTPSVFKVLYYANLTLPMFPHSRLQEHRYWTDRRLCWISWNLTHF